MLLHVFQSGGTFAHGSTAMHSISTSVPKGSCFAATHLSGFSDAWPLRVEDEYARSARLYFAPVLAVDFIHCSKVLHVSQEYIYL